MKIFGLIALVVLCIVGAYFTKEMVVPSIIFCIIGLVGLVGIKRAIFSDDD